jgi:hypothetical protein
MSLRRSVILALALVSLGCGSKEKGGDTGGSGSGTGTVGQPQPPQAAAGTLVFVDDKQVATVTVEQVATWPRLDTLVPEPARRLGKWQAIHLKTGKPKPTELDKPFEQHRDFVPALFPGESGTVSFGMFDPVELGKKGTPAVREDGVVEVRIKLADDGRGMNDHGTQAVVEPQNIKLDIKTKAGTQTLSGEKLLAITREGMPGGGGDAKGWKLATILEAGGVKTWKKIVLLDEGGVNLIIEAKDLDDKTIPFVKLNRQGSLRFRIFKQQGDGWTPSGDLRALKSIEVLE